MKPTHTPTPWSITPDGDITAAPELLEALYDTAHQLQVILDNESCEIEAEMREIIEATIQTARAAIAKAEGKQS